MVRIFRNNKGWSDGTITVVILAFVVLFIIVPCIIGQAL